MGKLNAVEKLNCWEHKKCGRDPDGPRARELGICPVTTREDLHGAHGGQKGGRACWVIAGSLCGGKIQGTFAQKLTNCWRCDFFNKVKEEEDPTPHGFSVTLLGIQSTLKKTK